MVVDYEIYKDFGIAREDDGNYSVYHAGELCGLYTTYSQACDAVDKFYKYFGGSANVTL